MHRIGLSQRIDGVPGRDERRDGLDLRWYSLCKDMGVLAIPLPNGPATATELVDGLGLAGIILTGGNDVAEAPQAANVAPERDRLERALIALCLGRGLPLLGVCRGMQMINVALGGKLGRVEGHAGVSHMISSTEDAPWPKSWRVNSYHDVCIPGAGLAPSLRCLARAKNGDVEAFLHEGGRCHGIMWHPEREAPPRAEDITFMSRALEL
ncbi:MAG: gamma-glutamyl-gamma-aminobutyrate hydrolase family protein [Alphaproteobacteria bacterium]